MIVKKNKYHNKKLETPDGKFDSKREYQEWCRLKLLQKAGLISALERQKEFQLIPTIRTEKETLRRTSYFADFFYFDTSLNVWVANDTKGYKTDVFQIKKKLMLWLYPNIVFVESGKVYKEYKNVLKIC